MITRRGFLQDAAASVAAVTAVEELSRAASTAAEPSPAPTGRRASGSQRRWRAAFGLNGFQSSESLYGHTFPI